MSDDKDMCPILSKPPDWIFCDSSCRLLISIYTTEDIEVQMCAFEAMAKKDEHGKIPV